MTGNMDNTEAVLDAVLETVTQSDLEAAAKAEQEVNDLVVEIQSAEGKLSSGISRLGTLLLTIRNQKYWIIWGFKSFGQYIKSLPLGRTQAYQTISVAETLLPLIGEESLSD